jgi:hypothetical protein
VFNILTGYFLHLINDTDTVRLQRHDSTHFIQWHYHISPNGHGL